MTRSKTSLKTIAEEKSLPWGIVSSMVAFSTQFSPLVKERGNCTSLIIRVSEMMQKVVRWWTLIDDVVNLTSYDFYYN